MTHHHIYLLAITFFIVGNALHGLVQVNDVATKTKQSRRKVLADSWIPLLVRGFLGLCLFVGLLEGQIDDILIAAHVPIPMWLQGLLDINVNSGWIAGLAGYVFDSALGYIPKIQQLGVPPSIESTTPGAPVPAPPK